MFQPIIDSLLYQGDYYFHLADFDSYVAAQQRVSCDFQNVPAWAGKAILNVARSGKFTSDRAVSEYAKDIWGIKSIDGVRIPPRTELLLPVRTEDSHEIVEQQVGTNVILEVLEPRLVADKAQAFKEACRALFRQWSSFPGPRSGEGRIHR